VLCDSRSAFSACVDNSPVNLFAGPGAVCIVSGESYNGAGTNIAVQASGLGATITWTSVGLSKILTSGAGLPAAQADDGGSIAITGGSIETSGAAAPAILSKGGEGGSSVTLSGGTTILTVGDGSAGLAVSGSGASLTAAGADPSAGVDVKTLGVGSIGATNGLGSGLEPGGTMNLTHTTIVTEGQDAHAVAVSGAGSETHLGAENALTTQGDGAIGIYATGGGVVNGTGGVVTITTSGANSEATGLSAFGVNADGPGSQVNLPGLIVTTAGANAYGLYASDGGAINAEDGPSIATHGAGAIGVYASGAGSSVAVGGGATIATAGASAAGLQADAGGLATLNGGSVTTTGIGASGLSVDGAGSKIMASNVAVATNGGYDLGTESFSFGLVASNGGSATVSGGSITTNGPVAHGVFAFNSGSVALSAGTTVLTTGGGSFGLFVNGAGSSLTATDVNVTTDGGVGPAFGDAAIGAYNGFASPGDPTGGAMTLTDTTITTSGTAAVGVETNSGGVTNISGGAVATSGQDAHALFVTGAGSRVNLSGATTFATQGDGAIGLYALRGGVITASGQTTVATTGSVSASTGLPAYGINADGAGSQVNLAAATITTTGAGAAGLYASNVTGTGHGGAIVVSGPLGIETVGLSAYGAWAQGAGSTIALDGPTTIALSGDRTSGLMAAAGGAISAQGSTSIAVSGAGSIGVQALSGTVTASGALNVTTSQATSAAFALGGASPSIIALGGGTVSAAGNAIAFTNATNAVATFDNFNIKNAAGDLILADPSSATINFNNTIANAGAGNLLNAAAGSTVAFNASASTLTGAIQTDPTSLTKVSLANGTNWAMTASSTVTNLNLTNSAIVFAPSAGFKTLTLGSYVGTGANIALNTALGGPSAGSTDQLVINGGSAAGSTSLTIKNASGAAGAATTGNGIPVVAVSNGGTTATNAFYLANGTPILAGGYEYTLWRGSNQDWYLTSSPAASMSQIQSSVTSLAQAQLKQLVTSRVLGSLLLGATEQVNGCSCGGGFASIGSFSLGSHGRWALNDSVTLLAGAAFESYYQDGANVRAAPIVAASLRYDPPNWGKSRPFFEVGAALSPYIDTTYTRYYTNGLTPAQGVGSAVDRSVSVFGRVGWVDRLTPVDEAAVFADLVRGWQQSGGYSEVASAVNPFPATVSTGVDRQDVVRFGAQYTRLLFGNIEGNINGAIAYGFDNEFGSRVNVTSFGSVAPYPLLNSAWTEFGGRLAYRFSRNLVVDAFLIGTLGGEIGPTLHGGLGVRYAF
jgi:autotransporter family porin